MPLFTRRHFCLNLCAAALLPAPPTEPEPSAALLYGQAVRMLREGRTFEKAAAHFARAGEMEPRNGDYQIALGCAYACRAASLAWASAFSGRLAAEQAAFPKWQENWNMARQWLQKGTEDKTINEEDQKKYQTELEKYRPKPPPARDFLIKDGKKPFGLTRVELATELTELNRNALTAWEKSITLSKTPEEKARAHYVRGWGMRVLQFYLMDGSLWQNKIFESRPQDPPPFRYYFEKPLPLELKGLPTDAQIKAAFEEAVTVAPENPLYLQAKADFLASKETGSPDSETTELYRRAANLAPKNANLWNRIYDRETAYRYSEKQVAAPSALDDLHHAQARDKANAWYGYEEAGRIMADVSWEVWVSPDATFEQRQAAYDVPRTNAAYAAGKRATDLIERANALPRFVPPSYQESVPALLLSAWQYVPSYWRGDEAIYSVTRFQNMGRTVRFYAQSLAADKQNEPEAVRVLQALLQAGRRIEGEDAPPSSIVSEQDYQKALWNIAAWTMANIAYSGLLIIVKKDTEAHATLTRDRAAWEARFKKTFDQISDSGVRFVYEIYDRN